MGKGRKQANVLCITAFFASLRISVANWYTRNFPCNAALTIKTIQIHCSTVFPEAILLNVRSEVLTAVGMKMTIFWDTTPCSRLKVNWSYGKICRLHLQGRRKNRARNQRESRWQAELQILVGLQRTTRRYIPEDRNRHKFVGFEIPTAVIMKCHIFWDITPCSPLKVTDVSEEHVPSSFQLCLLTWTQGWSEYLGRPEIPPPPPSCQHTILRAYIFFQYIEKTKAGISQWLKRLR
jgi:hypothetical protein